MTGTIKMDFTENGIAMDVEVCNVDAVDTMMAMHAMKTALKMSEDLWKRYVVCEHLGILDPDKEMHMDRRMIDILQRMGDAGDEG